MWNPKENTRGNVAFGFGVMLPTGKDNVMNRVDAFDGLGPRDVLLDYSIQPGSGGYGLVFQWQAFKNLGSQTQAYFNGNYIATPQNTNGVRRRTTGGPLTQYVSISDQVGIPLTQPTTTCRLRVWRTIREQSRSLRIDFRPKGSAGPIW